MSEMKQPMASAIIACAVALAAGTPDAQAGSWAQYGYDAGHSFHNPREATLSAANVSSLQLRWATTNADRDTGDVAAAPVYRDGRMYLCTSISGLYVRDTVSGALTTRYDDWPAGGCGDMALGADRLIANSNSTVFSNGFKEHGYLKAIKPGQVAWSTQHHPQTFSTPVFDGTTAYTADGEGLVYAFRAKNGAARWTADIGNADGTGSGTRLAHGDGKLVALHTGSASFPELMALDAATGTRAWRVDLFDYNAEPLLVRGGRVLVTGFRFARAFDLHTGAALWKTTLGIDLFQPLAADDTAFYVSGFNGLDHYSVMALDPQTGASRWETALDGAEHIVSNVAVANGVLYVIVSSSADNTYYLATLNAATGVAIKRYVETANLLAPAALGWHVTVADGLVQVASARDGRMAVFALAP